MATKTEIDRQLAELERLARGGNLSLEEPSSTRKAARRRLPRLPRMPSWLTIIGIAAVVDLAARFFIPSSMPFVLVFEAMVFLGAAVALVLPIVRKAGLTGFRLKVHIWLSAVLALGAVRSGMWGLGVAVEYANLTIFLIGLAGLIYAYVKRGKDSDVDP